MEKAVLQPENKTTTIRSSFFKPAIQKKLNIGSADDSYEVEADNMANNVMRINEPSHQNVTQTGALLQRKCAHCEEEEKLQRKPLAECITPLIQRSSNSESEGNASSHIENQINNSKGGGSNLDNETKSFMENRFGTDFSDVKIHTGSQAVQMSRELNAQAFTVGNAIYFNEGKFNPSSDAGKHLLAHELTHTVQQSGAIGRKIQRDWALVPPRPNAIGAVLNPAKILEAIAFNENILNNIPNSVEMIGLIRDVLGINKLPSVIDEDFVNAVVNWQAVNRMTQDGKLGPATARPLFLEIGAEGAGRCEIDTGPSYSPRGTINVPAGLGARQAFFRLASTFKSDPANKILPSCCEVRQFIRWNAAAAASFAPGVVPHAGFPAAHPVNTWIEDRDDTVNNRYGHRSGTFSDPQSFDQYLDSSGRRNQAFGNVYAGSDSPGGTGMAGQWRFMIKVLDVCNGNTTIGSQDFVNVNW
ncbi:eCIS core domain-containing protein [Flavobacterium cellulosilyticum]|uniref:DUF4157 domain-containing protein n=1 Tax=Flavobacterium cellulosilyticum TaxID=2541731 RepID=A0A4R5C845_9FLAO|nr:DUF4157 domain-containing protein [Flavobacterium cellulosilyticum]TDD96001.1 DUF4157 domain-containing protein [Flavobacterium cellulosilyticum]